ncbi:major facilitator superfamily transport protein [Natrialba magadii ATCC 43099]|uniref:Major facilitator superfamily protein n=1 Tax=Natrialba magadii (strain ATCC 43099 / DSM 3394 / CCM 3739 / CIP 104546 / IAM 13178 / JCM 8861 / NBRC 102185 / NCIMB 2190 / MS3) TaxID=547559 RepID=D3SVL7_NATMM|nr:MFS transporter [Natrialba magadii]ADD05625.1 major facilitator superfamily transport protein [Natrialba magadii ATCC 43099]ELY29962.1 major facilitator superfamily protein [Natrialba magadii ATCC 43099]
MDDTTTADGQAEYSSRRRYLIIGSVVASTFFVGFGGGVIFPILPNLGELLGISPFLVGFILSANRFSRLVANAPAGSLVDRIGTRTPFIAGLLIQSVGTFGYVIAMVAPLPEAWFLLARLVWGIGSALVFATAYTIAADVSKGGSRGTSMGLIRGGSIFGFPTGLVLGGIVSEVAGINAAFIVATAFALVASVMAYMTVPETHVEGENRQTVSPWNIDTSLTTVTVGLVNFAVLFAYIGALFATLVLFLDEHGIGVLGFDAQGTSGIFMAVTVLAAAVFMFLGGFVSDRTNSRIPTLLVFLVVSFVGFILLAGADSVATLTLACIFIGAGQGGTSGPLMALLADLTPNDEMGRAAGTNNVLGDVGGGLGPLISIPIVEVVGFAPVYAACAVMPLIAGAILLGGVYRETGMLLPATRLRGGINESLDD